MDEGEKRRAVLTLLRGIFGGSENLIGTDFDNVDVKSVEDCDFEQQPNGNGIHISFSISHHALGKVCNSHGHDALEALLD